MSLNFAMRFSSLRSRVSTGVDGWNISSVSRNTFSEDVDYWTQLEDVFIWIKWAVTVIFGKRLLQKGWNMNNMHLSLGKLMMNSISAVHCSPYLLFFLKKSRTEQILISNCSWVTATSIKEVKKNRQKLTTLFNCFILGRQRGIRKSAGSPVSRTALLKKRGDGVWTYAPLHWFTVLSEQFCRQVTDAEPDDFGGVVFCRMICLTKRMR